MAQTKSFTGSLKGRKCHGVNSAMHPLIIIKHNCHSEQHRSFLVSQCLCNCSSMTLLSSATFTDIKPEMTHKPSRKDISAQYEAVSYQTTLFSSFCVYLVKICLVSIFHHKVQDPCY